ncbi:MAG: hypothetical protein AB1631_02505 [Acidobacteriota bacterium]
MRKILSLAFLITTVAILGSGCIRRVKVAERLPVEPDISTEDLLRRINSYSEIKAFSAQTSIYVRNYFTGSNNKADDYPSATGILRLRRPENILMRVTFIGARVADMVTDGRDFKVAIYRPESKRQFVYGSNLKGIDRLDREELDRQKDPRLKEAGGLVNMRPQHITDAFLIPSVAPGDGTVVFREEVPREETLIEPGKKKRLVLRTYYVIYVLEQRESGQFELRRKYWFDRTTPGTPLARQQTFENGAGKLGSDIAYEKWQRVPGLNLQWPERIIVDRLYDGYKLEIELDKDSIEVNGELPDRVFDLKNTEGLPEVNLDAPRKAAAPPEKKSNIPIRY